MSSLLLTGAGSKFARPLISKLSKRFNKVTALSRNSLNKYEEKNVQAINFDLTKSYKIPVKADIVIHLASIVPYNKNYNINSTPLNYNLRAFNNLLRFCVNKKVRKVIFISSTDVYPLFSEKKITHKTNFECHNEYGLSKLACERLLDTYSSIYRFKSSVLRIGPIYSEKNFTSNKISRMLHMLKRNKPIKIENPNNILSLLSLECAVKAIVNSIKSPPGKFLIVGNPLLLSDFFESAKKSYKSKSIINIFKKNNSNIKLIFNLRNTKKILKWSPVPKNKMFLKK